MTKVSLPCVPGEAEVGPMVRMAPPVPTPDAPSRTPASPLVRVLRCSLPHELAATRRLS